jgi:hypothetical protein
MRTLIIVTLVLIIILFSSCSKTPTTTEQTPPTRTLLEQQVDKFASTDVGSPLEDLKAKDLTLLNKLVEASDQIDEIFWRQAYAKNPELRQKLEVSKNPKDQTTLHLFNIMRGPFDRLQDNKPFLGTQPKPRGAGIYPEDLTKEEFQKWVADHPKDAAAFESPYTVIQRDGKKLKAVPYSAAYKQWLEPAAKNLEEAAALTDDAALKKFLLSRAKAFRTNDYYQSDMDWMDAAGSKMDVTIGPYEVYEDALLNQKASFEAFIGVRDDESSKALSVYESYIDALENNLPLDPKYQSSRKGKLSPLIVINELYTGGEARRGVQTAAFTLPNDERVRAAKGSKKIMLKNVMQAKFAKTLVPIAIRLVVDDQLPNVKFDPFFNHVLLHEMSHALGPGLIQKGKDKITVNKALKDQYSAIEEAKADVLGLYNVEFLAQKKVFSEVELPSHYISYLASLFRSVRFGAEEAHGRANLLQFNFLMKEGGIQFDDKRLKFRADIEKMKAATKKLATVLLTIEAEGDYDGAKKLMEEQGTMSPQLQSALRRLSDIPVDIEPVFLIGRK